MNRKDAAKYGKFWLYLALVAIVGYIVGSSLEPGPLNPPKPQGTYVPHGRGSTPPAAATSTVPAAPSAVQNNGAAQPSAPPARAPIVGKDGNQILVISQLFEMLDARPTSVLSIMELSGTNKVLVSIAKEPNAIVTVPSDGGKKDLRDKAIAAHVTFGVKEPYVNPLTEFLSNNWMFLLIGGFIVFSLLRARGMMSGGMSKLGGMGKNRGKKVDAGKSDGSVKQVGWNDIAGCDEAVLELQRLVSGLADSSVYDAFGGKLPTGIILVGPPGTGKTLLARVVANEAKGMFVATSGSEFVEMLAGVGASRVRDMFAEAREWVKENKRPYFIFIDEIDAIGGKRGSSAMNKNEEREQTLNQLLVEMDGIVGNHGIVIIAATNRVDMLDEALLRPGRFNNQVTVDLPDVVGRAKIFGIHLRKKAKLADGVTLEGLAKVSYSFSGAEIENACDRAAFLAAEDFAAKRAALIAEGKTVEEIKALLPIEITMKFFDEGLSSTKFGDAKPSKQKNMAEKTKLHTSRHEAGHAFATVVFPQMDPVVKITVMMRSKSLGFVMTMPLADRLSWSRSECIARIVMMMAGRAAQEKYLKTADSGASNDFQQATNLARTMVQDWGMTKVGRIKIARSENQFGGGMPGISDALANEVDAEVRDILERCYQAAYKIVEIDKERMDALTDYLMEHETMLGEEFAALCERIPSKVKLAELNLPYWSEEEFDAA